jgi:two-component system, NtrC family, response regulator PilR
LEEENQLLKAEFQARHGVEHIVGKSTAMKAVFDLMRSVAPTSSTVLVTGESGTGKELVAKAIHTLSPRRDAPFVSINCGALPENLLESELFGHVKGAFTDAQQNKKGLFEAANRGTLFLDEVGDMPLPMQVKLLRALQERKIRRVGGTDEIDVDVRIVAATNRTLETMVRERHFREDLYYRLNVIPLRLPALRERPDDIPLLVEHFLQRFRKEMGKEVSGVSPEGMRLLVRHDWPGNVRELENVVERAMALETGPVILEDRLLGLATEGVALSWAGPDSNDEIPPGFNIDRFLLESEAALLRRALKQTAGDRAIACRLLGLSSRSLRYLIQKHSLGD